MSSQGQAQQLTSTTFGRPGPPPPLLPAHTKHLHMLSLLTSQVDDLEWKNQNSFEFDLAYVVEVMGRLKKEAEARERKVNEQLQEMHNVRKGVEMAVKEAIQDIRNKEQKAIQSIKKQSDDLRNQVRSQLQKTTKMRNHLLTKLHNDITSLSTQHNSQHTIILEQLQVLHQSCQKKINQLESALKLQQQSSQQSSHLIIDLLSKFYQKHHQSIKDCKAWREQQRARLIDVVEYMVKELRKSV